MSATNIASSTQQIVSDEPTEIKVYKKRWLMLSLFVLYSLSNAEQWVQFTIIENIVERFYGVSSSFVEWTSMIYMVSYIVLIVPGSWALDRFGLRKCIVVGALGTCLGSWIKVFAADPNLFSVAFTGQAIVAASQVFILSLPARLAAVWFGHDQISTACSIGVFGNQAGIAVGFIVPPYVVQDVTDVATLTSNFKLLFLLNAGLTTIILLLVLFLFKEAPELPPSRAVLNKKLLADKPEIGEDGKMSDFIHSLGRLFTNTGYNLLLLSYGINVGIFYAISTLLNKVVLLSFPNATQDAGTIGLVIVVAGTLGSVAWGFILDKTGRFKETTFLVYLFSLIGMTAFSFTLECSTIAPVYVSAAALGFFMTGYLPVGFELAAELTYPEAEGTSVGILNGSVQVTGLIFTLVYSALIDAQGSVAASLYLDAALALGLLLTWLIPKNYKRQDAGSAMSTQNN